MKRNNYFSLVLVSLLFSSAFAADSTLTLKNIIDLAITQGIKPLQSRNQVTQKDLAVEQASSIFLPSFNSSISTEGSGTTFTTQSSSGSKGTLNTRSWSASNSVSMSAGGSYSFAPSSITDLQAAKVKSDAARYLYKQTVNDITSDAVQLYINALYALKKVGIVQSNLDSQKEKLLQIEEFRAAGKKSIADVLQQQTAVAEGDASLLEKQQGYGRIVLSICNIAALPFDSDIILDTNELVRIIEDIGDQNFAEQEINYDTIPKIKAQKLAVQAAEITIKGDKLSYYPSLSSSISISSKWQGPTISTQSSTALKSGFGTSQSSWSDPRGGVSLSLSYPIFDRYKRRQNLQSSLLGLQSTQLQLDADTTSVSLEFHKIMYDLEIAKKKIEVADIRLYASKQSLDAITERYNAGASTLIEVASVNNSYLNAVNSRLQAESEMLLAQIDLIKQRGQIYEFIENLFSLK